MTFSFLDGWWTDAGTFDSLLRAANLVAQSVLRKRIRAGCGGRGGAGVTAARGTAQIASANLELALPDCEKGIGAVIGNLDSPDLIAGVRVQPLPIFPDDRGYFLEVQRIGHGLAAHFPPETTQISAALNYPGTVKAFHFHLHQTDCWTPAKGMLQVALVDLRLGSPTFGIANTMYVGPLRPWQLLIPPGVAHGYKVIGKEDALLVYLTDRSTIPRTKAASRITTRRSITIGKRSGSSSFAAFSRGRSRLT